jgi:phage protein U
MAFQRPTFAWEKEDTRRLTFGWGELVFEASGAAVMGLRFGRQQSWAQLARFATRSAVQYTGTDLETVSLSGVIMLGGFKAFDALRQQAAVDIEPHTLVETSSRRTFGFYALTSITADIQQMTPTGELRSASWTLEFVEAPADSDAVRNLNENAQGGDTT